MLRAAHLWTARWSTLCKATPSLTIDLIAGVQIAFATGNATVVMAGVSASNDIVHDIDTVLVPPTGSAVPTAMPSPMPSLVPTAIF